MGIFDRLLDFITNPSSAGSSELHSEINPATGLPMVGGIGSVDVMGNPYGTDLHRWEDGNMHDNSHDWHHDHGTYSSDHWSHNMGCGHDQFSWD